MKASEATTVWLITGGDRTAAASTQPAWTIPTRVLDAIPLG
ncbi:hypothetical protein [Streptomyces sp. DH24]|nr:hypothetical protein [Streptomyces sp. DH24]MDG9720686.1 hypothetical protein [Streptomyces sp. DH24]